MPYPNPSRCRVALHTDSAQLDLALPTGVPVAALIVSVVELLATRGAAPHSAATAAPYRLSLPGTAALDGSKTLAQYGIRDGTVLVLARGFDEPPAPRFDDPADQLSATVRARTVPWTPTASRLTAGLAAVWLAAVAGLAALPGDPGGPHALLAAAAAAAVAVAAMQLFGCTGAAMTAVCIVAVLAAAGALAVVLTGVSAQVAGAATATAAIGLLQPATRIAVAVAGVGPARESGGFDAAAGRAHDLLTGLVAAFSVAAALGVAGAATGTQPPRFGGAAFAAAVGAALLLRARSHTDRSQIAALLVGGIGAVSVALTAAALSAGQHPLWPCATAAALAGAAVYLGCAAPEPSPAIRRGIELLEYPVLAAVVPLGCWVCGWYGAVRGWSPG